LHGVTQSSGFSTPCSICKHRVYPCIMCSAGQWDMIEMSEVEYVAFELFRLEQLRQNPRTSAERIKTLWQRGRQGFWRTRAENAIGAIARWRQYREPVSDTGEQDRTG
jgi:hypothetical protein